jgi:hypothetical protein
MSKDELHKLIRCALRETLEESKKLEQEDSTSRRTFRVNMNKLKEFAISNLPEGSRLREILLAEKDEVDPEEFIAKVGIWLKLLRMESSL